MDILAYSPYRAVSLTPSGNRIAVEVIRHHRLIKLYLKVTPGYGLEKVHAEAQVLAAPGVAGFAPRLLRRTSFWRRPKKISGPP